MTAYDYSRPLASARRLVARYGRVISLQGVSAGPADANNPLAGPAAAPDPLTGIPAAFVDPLSLRGLGLSSALVTLFANSSNIAIVAPVSGMADFMGMKFMIDSDGTVSKIDRIETLKPSEVILLYYIGISTP